jgi:DNA-directed RNA polymerase specialized sigma24 family protein
MSEMQPPSDAQLLRDYAERGAETAFGEIVARHTDLVYAAALRQVYSPDLARDVTQSVFTDLARKARTISAKLNIKASLVGWLYRGTRFAARDFYRNETRRIQRERQAMEQLHSPPETPSDWSNSDQSSTMPWPNWMTPTATPCCSATSKTTIFARWAPL